jgi:hypothetical protein
MDPPGKSPLDALQAFYGQGQRQASGPIPSGSLPPYPWAGQVIIHHVPHFFNFSAMDSWILWDSWMHVAVIWLQWATAGIHHGPKLLQSSGKDCWRTMFAHVISTGSKLDVLF